MHAIRPARDHVANRSLVNLFDDLLERFVVPAHQAAGDLEVSLRRFFACRQHASHARRIDGERLLHEDVAIRLHGVVEMDRSKRGWRCQQAPRRRVRSRQSPSDTHPCPGTVAPSARRPCRRTCLSEILETRSSRSANTSAMATSFTGPCGRQGIVRRTCAAPAATDQGDLDRVVFRSVAAHVNRLEQRSAGQCAAGVLQEFPSRSGSFRSLSLRVHAPALSQHAEYVWSVSVGSPGGQDTLRPEESHGSHPIHPLS